MMPPAQYSKALNFHIVGATVLLVMIGLLAIYAASSLKGTDLFGNPYFFLQKQLIAVGIGTAVILVLRSVPFHWIESATLPLLIATLLCLSLIFLPGAYSKVGGAQRWLSLGFLRFQPSELAKIAVVFFLAKNLSRKKCRLDRFWSGVLPNLIVLGLFAGLLLRQPDFGSTVLLAAVTFCMLFVAGIPQKFLLFTLGPAILAGLGAIIAAPYRMRRLLNYLDPWGNIHEGGFQIIQSYLAFQNGGLLGVGLGESRQKLFFLPEAHTDFILSVIAEELGFLGTACVCLLFAYLIAAAMKISALQPTLYRKLLGFGLTSLVAIQALFNIGVVTGLLPTKGIPLPLISSGASSLLTFFIIIGILLRLGYDLQRQQSTAY